MVMCICVRLVSINFVCPYTVKPVLRGHLWDKEIVVL